MANNNAKPQFSGEWVRLGDAFELRMGKTPSRKNMAYWRNGKHDWVSIADLGTFDKYVGTTKEQISDLAVTKSGIKPAPANTVLMSFKLSIGKVAITRSPVFTNEAIMALVDKGKYQIDPTFIYHQCKAKDWTAGSNTAVMGKTLNKRTLSEARIYLPELDRQIQIAAKLDYLDTHIVLANAVAERLDALVKSRFIEMFGDALNSDNRWPERTLGSMLDIARGGSPRPIKSYLTSDPAGINWIKIGDAVNGSRYIANTAERIKPSGAKKSRLVHSGDFLLSNSMSFGRPYILKTEGCIHDGWLVLQGVDEYFNSLFLYQLLASDDMLHRFRGLVRGGVVNNLNKDLVSTVSVMVPPIGLQRDFATFVQQVDKLRFDVQQQIEKLELLKNSLMQEYFG